MNITTMVVTMATMEMEEEEVITAAGVVVEEEEAMVVAEEIVIGTDLESVTMHLGGKR
jgi:hypothetical protein